MIKKFAVLAIMATVFVACGGNSAAEMEAKAKVTADSLAAVAQADSIKMADDAAKAVAAVDSAAKAAMDTISTKVEGAVIGH